MPCRRERHDRNRQCDKGQRHEPQPKTVYGRLSSMTIDTPSLIGLHSQSMRKVRKPYRLKTRSVKFQLRLTDEEYKLLVARASEEQKTLAAYLREKALT